MIMKTSNGYEFEIDECDYDLVSMYSWRVDSSGFVRATIYDKNVTLHRLLMGFPIMLQIDHIDRNRLNNKRDNLRVCTNAQNQCNRSPRVGCSSKYIGVSWCKGKKWQVNITINGIKKHVGYSRDEKIAAKMYNDICLKERGKWAVLNDI